MLDAAFLKAELEYLKREPRFNDALANTQTNNDFIQLCDLGESLLGDEEMANSCTHDFRHR